jgi:hypothetical protein
MMQPRAYRPALKVKSVSSTVLWGIAVAAALLLFEGAGAPRASAEEQLLRFTREDVPREERVAAFVDAFIDRDPQARGLLNPGNRTLFAEGYRPTVGVPNNPERGRVRFTDLRPHFIRKLYLDLNAVRPLNQGSFESFVDQISYDSGQNLKCTVERAIRHAFNVERNFIFQKELAKIPNGPGRDQFNRCWLSESILGTEARMLGWIFRQLFGVPYNPKP